MASAYFFVTISAPDQIVWSGEATELRAANSDGPFTILPDHARFMTLVSGAPIELTTIAGEQQTFTFAHAVLFFSGDTAKLYVHDDVTDTAALENSP